MIDVNQLKLQFPVGSRVRLTETMEDPYHPIPRGSEGVVRYVDDMGHIGVNWDKGGSLSLIPGIDSFEKV